MAQPDNVTRFFYYLSLLREGAPIHEGLLAEGLQVGDREIPPVRRRQFLDDMAYLRKLLPLWEPGTCLESLGEGRYGLGRTAGKGKLAESEFLPFLKALVLTTNLFPYPQEGWLGLLAKTYDHPELAVLEGRILYTSTPHPDRLKREHFYVLVQSLVERKRVNLTYRNREGAERKIDLEPMTFLNHNGVWYIVGDGQFAHRPGSADGPTQLKLSRIRLCSLGTEPYRHRFDLGQTTARLRATYGSHTILTDQREPMEVTLRFFGEAVRHVEESWFHADQKTAAVVPGTLDLTIRVNDLFDALQLAGQWGTLCRPVSPPELVERWKERIADLADWAGSAG